MNKEEKTTTKIGIGLAVFAAVFIFFFCINPFITVGVFMWLIILLSLVY